MTLYHTTRKWINQVLAQDSSSVRALEAQVNCVAKRILDLRRFAPWPALEESLMEDLVRLHGAYLGKGGPKTLGLVSECMNKEINDEETNVE